MHRPDQVKPAQPTPRLGIERVPLEHEIKSKVQPRARNEGREGV